MAGMAGGTLVGSCGSVVCVEAPHGEGLGRGEDCFHSSGRLDRGWEHGQGRWDGGVCGGSLSGSRASVRERGGVYQTCKGAQP